MLADILKVNRCHAIGIVECLVQWVQTYGLQDDLWEWPNSVIATGCYFSGDPDQLIEALIDSKLLDKVEVSEGDIRLVLTKENIFFDEL